MELIEIQPKPDAPLVCDFTGAPDTPEERFDEYSRLFRTALVDRERTAEGMVLTFAKGDGVADWITDLVKREAACCSFLRFEVSADDSAVQWTTSGSPDAQPVIDELYRLADGNGPPSGPTTEGQSKPAIPIVDHSRP